MFGWLQPNFIAYRHLQKGWATGEGYREKILSILNSVLKISGSASEKAGWVQEDGG